MPKNQVLNLDQKVLTGIFSLKKFHNLFCINMWENMKYILVSVAVSLLALGCGKTAFKSTGNITDYNLSTPDSYFVLPKILHEISGQTYIDSTSFASIQDNNGILFIYDILNNRIKNESPFSDNGDYEDIARVDSTIFILRSDGKLFEISDFRIKHFVLTTFKTGIPCEECEGLCYDSKNDRLLISCKGKILKKGYSNKTGIYSFDLKTRKLSAEPVLLFDIRKVRKLVASNKFELSKKLKKEMSPEITFKISAISLHPLTGELYVLSSIDKMMYVVDKKGVITNIESLDPKLFNQAEGLLFFPNGDMLISNEGADKKPTLLRFNYKKSK